MLTKNKKGYIKNLLKTGLYSIICGILVGIAIFAFKYIAKELEHLSIYLYNSSKTYIICIVFIFIALIALATLMHIIHKSMPEVKGGGIPKSEGVLRGILHFKSHRTLLGTFLGSILSFFAGVPVGTEGPSVLIGTSIADLCNKTSKKNKAQSRYVNTGGAAAGFAVATGAPFAGILFALEEIHKRFTPMLVVSVSLSVLSAMFMNISLCNLCDLNYELFHFNILVSFEYKDIIYILILALLIALSVGCFDKSVGLLMKLSKKLNNKISPFIKLLALFIITGILGYTFIDGIYSGHSVIEALIINDKDIWYLLLLLLIRLVLMYMVIDSGITGGIFIPTMTIAATIGAILGKLLILIGLDESYFILIVVITMCAFMGGTLRAPLTGAILFFELTSAFNNMFYIVLIIFIVNFIVEIFDQPSFYDRVLENMEEEEYKNKVRKIDHFTMTVSEGSYVVGKTVRDVMWPQSLVVLNITRENETMEKLDNDGERKIYAKDKIIFKCRYYDEEELFNNIYDLVGSDYPIIRQEKK